jgi:hypothetical protein
MSNVFEFRPKLVVSSLFMAEFVAAEAPCFALGLIEDRALPFGLIALKLAEPVPKATAAVGMRFGHSLFGNQKFIVVHFAFEFYGYRTFNAIVKPDNPIVRRVLSAMVETGTTNFMTVDDGGSATIFSSDLGSHNLAGLDANLPRILSSVASEADYQLAMAHFERDTSPGVGVLNWVCHDNPAYLDLSQNRMDMSPTR